MRSVHLSTYEKPAICLHATQLAEKYVAYRLYAEVAARAAT